MAPSYQKTDQEHLFESLLDRLRSAGFENVEQISSDYDPDHFGNAVCTFRLRNLLLRVTRDRTQEFVYLAPASMPEQFFLFEDVEIAMGWRSMEDVLGDQDTSITQPEDLDAVLGSLAGHMTELEAAFSPKQKDSTLMRLKRAADFRGRTLIDRLQGK